jgi:hypothetical protein
MGGLKIMDDIRDMITEAIQDIILAAKLCDTHEDYLELKEISANVIMDIINERFPGE